MKLWKLFIGSILVSVNLSCGTSLNSNSENKQIVSSKDNVILKIETAPDIYSLSMSSTVGISLNPVLKDINNYKIVFKTEKGFFLSWNNQVKNLGKEVVFDGTKIYWSYDSKEKFSDAEIKVSVLDKISDENIQNTIVKIKIDDKGFATVLNNNPINTNNSQNNIDNTRHTAFKGMEIYTWKEGDKQFFSLLEGTNRAKTKDEITKVKIDFNVLKTKVSELPEGEIIVFLNTIEGLGTTLLSTEMKQELKNICDNKKITLSLEIDSNISNAEPVIKANSNFKIDMSGSYSKYISQMPGIPLLPILRDAPLDYSNRQITDKYKHDIEKYKFIFKTDNGFFLSWINNLENKSKEMTYTPGSNHYWSFNPEDKFTDAKIELIVLNKATGENIDNISIKIEMDKEGIAHVLQDYELYGWQENGMQYFSLFLGIGSKKTLEEIKAPRMDFNQLKAKISELPRSEVILPGIQIVGEALFQNKIDNSMKKELRELCNNKGIILILD